MDSPSPSGSVMPDGMDEDEEVDERAFGLRRGSLHDLIGAGQAADDINPEHENTQSGNIVTAAPASALEQASLEESERGGEESEEVDAGEQNHLASEAVERLPGKEEVRLADV